MKEEKIIQKLLGLGFKDESYSVDNPRFELYLNGFSLLYENGKFINSSWRVTEAMMMPGNSN
jgi:hypothetical protein